jgi:hypothetical protein
MTSGITKTDKLHLFDDRNLKSLIRLYNWNGQQRQKDAIKTNKKQNKLEETLELEEVIFIYLIDSLKRCNLDGSGGKQRSG